MDDVTRAVQAMYQKFPYPSGAPAMRIGGDARLLLSYVELSRDGSQPIHALDAGCGRGVGLIGNASLQGDVQFTGIDINTVGISEAAQHAAERNLSNINFQYCDLMTLEGLTVPPGGFDVIYSSGVLHHLSDPKKGLMKLKEVLAPHGVISFMVYGSYGRQPLTRLIEGIDLVIPRDKPLEQRLHSGRMLAQVAEAALFKDTDWQGTAGVDDVEFVDRCLHVNEASYDISSLWKLLDDVGMRFVRWIEPEQWSVEKLINNDEALRAIKNLAEVDQFKLIERLFSRPKLELILCKDSNRSRLPLTPESIAGVFFSLNPDVTFLIEKRNLRGNQRIEHLYYTLRGGERMVVEKGPLAQTLLLLIDQLDPFSGISMIRALEQLGISQAESHRILIDLVEKEILYCPHRCDI